MSKSAGTTRTEKSARSALRSERRKTFFRGLMHVLLSLKRIERPKKGPLGFGRSEDGAGIRGTG